ncbi:MAG: Gfo/Idh/MocA family oxidoreductase [Rhodobacterales bacterium]|nr:Gfo/Idh/MocA family oxidoreductase [Rhodobacterales bacterium]
MSAPVVTWGIIGCGAVTEVKSGPALAQAEGSRLVAVMRRDGAKAQDYAQRHGGLDWTTDAQALVNHPQVTAVYVATPPAAHRDAVLLAAAAGKAVLVEKPIAAHSRDGAEMVAACAAAGVPLSVAFYRRRLPRFQALREIVLSGRIGAPRAVSVRHVGPLTVPPEAWKVDPAVNGGGVFMDTQVHTLDWLTHVFGPPRAVSGLARNQAGAYRAEDTVMAQIAYAGGVTASFFCCYCADAMEETVTVIGTEGRASMGFFRPDGITLTTAAGTETIDLPDPPHVHQPFIQAVVDHIRGRGDNPCDGDTGLAALRTAEAILGTG